LKGKKGGGGKGKKGKRGGEKNGKTGKNRPLTKLFKYKMKIIYGKFS